MSELTNLKDLKVCLHVTNTAAIKTILQEGLKPQLGALAEQCEEEPGIWVFPTWADMEGAGWMWDNWDHDGDPALLLVPVQNLSLESDVKYEVVLRRPVPPGALTVLAATEEGWDLLKEEFVRAGGFLTNALPIAGDHDTLNSTPSSKRSISRP